MRIVYWCEQYWPCIGGIEALSALCVRELRSRGHDVWVIADGADRNLPAVDEYEGTPIHRFPFRKVLEQKDMTGIMQARQQVARLKERCMPNIVHVQLSGPSAFFQLATSGSGAPPWIVTVHQFLPLESSGRDSTMVRVLRSADWVTGVSQRLLDNVRALAPEVTAKSTVVYNGSAPPEVTPLPLPWPPRLLCLGRLVPEKGFDIALAALGLLRERVQGLEMIIAGDGPERPALQQLAGSLGLADIVEFAGWIAPAEVAALMNRATLVVVPSRTEGFGLVALEAALMARPVVASDKGGLVEVVVDGETGRIVPGPEPVLLADAMAALLADPGAAARFGQSARRQALAHFSLTATVDQYEALYLRLRQAA
jgi:glycosyltransferase involved in cell wall biosynthesis